MQLFPQGQPVLQRGLSLAVERGPLLQEGKLTPRSESFTRSTRTRTTRTITQKTRTALWRAADCAGVGSVDTLTSSQASPAISTS